MMIARNRRQAHLKTRGDHYHAVARTLEELHGECGPTSAITGWRQHDRAAGGLDADAFAPIRDAMADG